MPYPVFREQKQKELYDHRGQIEKIALEHLPVLQLRKKAAVQCREFLDAERLSKEIKEVDAKRDTHSKAASEAFIALERLNQEFKDKEKVFHTEPVSK